ncbi:MAG: GxxExxY protein [Blastocatellia bacterium]|nr:GxxExxY protein [Blastocatellia bacterium]
MDDKFLHKELSYKIVGLAMEVHRKLGGGFLEKVYENSLMILFRRENIKAEQQIPIEVYFEAQIVGDYIADILVENSIILELKAIDSLANSHRSQTINYLKATGLRVAYLINFGKKSLEYERFLNG